MSKEILNPEDDIIITNQELERQLSVIQQSLDSYTCFEKQLLLYIDSMQQDISNQMQYLEDLRQKNIESQKKMKELQPQIQKIKQDNLRIQQIIDQQMSAHQQPLIIAKKKLYQLQRLKSSKLAQQQILQTQQKELCEHLQILENRYTNLQSINNRIEVEIMRKQNDYKKINESIEELYMVKKKLNNQLQEIRGNIRVYCRIRPMLDNQQKQPIHQLINENTLKLKVPPENHRSQKHEKDLFYNFQQIFDMGEKQSNVFDELAQLIQSAIDGKNVCIFAYGQTGSGKTYTMQGGNDEQTKGIIPRSIQLIFSEIQKAYQYQWKYLVTVSIQQVYLDNVRDLLQIKSDQVDNRIIVNSPQQIYLLLEEASKNRKVAETHCNQHSSRSHLIFTIHLNASHLQKKSLQRKGSLNLVDLAGSQRVNYSKVQGQRMKQTQAINKSLTHLGVVIMALAKKEQHVPYRSSKLTYLLQKYLEGDSKTLMFVNISPKQKDYLQTLCSLRFAEQVKDCKIKK